MNLPVTLVALPATLPPADRADFGSDLGPVALDRAPEPRWSLTSQSMTSQPGEGPLDSPTRALDTVDDLRVVRGDSAMAW